MPEIVAYGDFLENSAVTAMERLLDEHPGLDAVFAASDAMAAGAMRVLKRHGKAIPGDVAVIGFEDSAIAAQTVPPLTSVHQPTEAMGRQMARLLVSRINGEHLEHPVVILDTHLVERGSA